jgi:FkbM family methyltransferase
MKHRDPSADFAKVCPPMEHVRTENGFQLKLCGGFWIAATDTSILRFLMDPRRQLLGRGTYQFKQLQTCLKLLDRKRRRVAVDVGAHVGTWTRILAMEFQTVYACEALPIHVECLNFNVPNWNVEVLPYAVSDKDGDVPFFNDTVKGVMSRIACAGKTGQMTVPARRLDVLIPVEAQVDFLKIDVEGHELPVVMGARELILRCKPMMILEQKDLSKDYVPSHDRLVAVRYLQGLGAKVLGHVGDDYILDW